jgi:hypothetical protein
MHTAISSQEARLDDPDGPEEGKDKREFKGEAEPEDEKRTKGDVFPHGDHGPDIGGLITQKKLDAVGERDKVAEACPQVEEKGGAQIDGEIGVPSPMKEGRKAFQIR